MRELILFHTIAFSIGVLLDLVIGDPHFVPHPVRAMGRLITWLESRMYKDKKSSGALLWAAVMLVTLGAGAGVLVLAYTLNAYLGIFTEAVLTCYCLAAKSLCRESMAVHEKLDLQDLEGARSALSMIVGRDTKELSKEEVIKATVETVAENTSDGVIAPLLYAAVGGPVLSLLYKAVNTMDSMLGYKNERYENFGFFAAKADDAAGFIPSRLSAVFMIASCALFGFFSDAFNGNESCRIWKRDRRNHLSPNSAQTESACAGAFGIRLGGTHLYQGVPVEKPAIGDEKRKPELKDIKRANALMFATEGITYVLLCVILALPAVVL